MVVFYEKHGPWKFLNCSCEFKAYQKKEEVYIYERAREGERERVRKRERERETMRERERESESFEGPEVPQILRTQHSIGKWSFEGTNVP